MLLLLYIINYCLLLQGFKVIIDTEDEYPITSRDPILIRPGHVVISGLL